MDSPLGIGSSQMASIGRIGDIHKRVIALQEASQRSCFFGIPQTDGAIGGGSREDLAVWPDGNAKYRSAMFQQSGLILVQPTGEIVVFPTTSFCGLSDQICRG